jgi:hypothetical protein
VAAKLLGGGDGPGGSPAPRRDDPYGAGAHLFADLERRGGETFAIWYARSARTGPEG